MHPNPHQGHHLSVRTTLWTTRIVCEECGKEYETAWNMLAHRFRRVIHAMLGFLMIAIGLALDLLPAPGNWLAGCIWILAWAAAIILGRIILNALQGFLLRRSDDLASHIF